MESRPATMAKVSKAGAPPPFCCLPEEIIVWEILTRLPPKTLLRCRTVCRSWCRATSTRDFLLAHHACQPSLPVISGEAVPDSGSTRYEDFVTFDHRAAAAKLQSIARLDAFINLESSCDGVLVLSKRAGTATCLSVCNPVTREKAHLVDFTFFSLLGMYMHRPTGEYRLLLYRRDQMGSIAGSPLPKGKIGCYVFTMGSDQPPRYIQGPEVVAALRIHAPSRVRGSLHWFPWQHQSESRMVLVFDTATESFRQMRAPIAPIVCRKSNIFEMDGTLGIYSYNDATEVFNIWMLPDYDGEVWNFRNQVRLPVANIRGQFGIREGSWEVGVASAGGDVLLMVSHGGWMVYVNTDGELVDSFHCGGQHIYAWDFRFKQTLVPHNFFTELSVNASPFCGSSLRLSCHISI